jgi:hypothetical protein
MASSVNATIGQHSFGDHAAAGFDPPHLARHKLDRLRELRAVIDTLHREREARDPLLSWVIERERVENHCRD